MSGVLVGVATELGSFWIVVDTVRAPKTTEYFLAHVDGGLLNSTSVYRIVKERSEGIDADCPIEVIQWGMKPDGSTPIEPVQMESTMTTKMNHKMWSVSTARFAADELYGGFFICMRDELSLDHGGQRHPDGLGFATFGHVESGFDTLRQIFAKAEDNNFLDNEIGIDRVVRI